LKGKKGDRCAGTEVWAEKRQLASIGRGKKTEIVKRRGAAKRCRFVRSGKSFTRGRRLRECPPPKRKVRTKGKRRPRYKKKKNRL